jgi:hypothetical protein
MRQLCHFFRADVSYGRGVAQELGLNLSEMETPMAAGAAV